MEDRRELEIMKYVLAAALLILVYTAPVLLAEEPASANHPGKMRASLVPDIRHLDTVSVIPVADTYLIDLPAALQLGEAANPNIALGREAICEALALQLGARGLLLPDLNAGANYHLHSGPLQTSFGEIRTLNEQSIYFGGGSRTLAAETVAIPAVRVFSQLGEALYAPLAARQVVSVRSLESTGVQNAVLLDVAARYLELVAAEARLEALRHSLGEFSDLKRTTSAFAQTGQGREGDYKRAEAETLLIQAEEQQAQEEVSLASAELARLLHLDQCLRLTTPQAPIELIPLVDPACDVEQLVQIAQAHRPEVAARNAAIGAAETRLKQEYVRPFLPLLSVGFSAGGFGGGSNRQDLGVSSFYQRTAARTDFDVFAIWSLQNMGAGNRAIQKQRRGERDQTISERSFALTQIRREVAEAYAQSRSRLAQAGIAQRRLKTAERGAREELIRTRAGEGLPIEALDSLRLLAEARQAAIRAAIGFNIAQFRLFVAIGETPTGAGSKHLEENEIEFPAAE